MRAGLFVQRALAAALLVLALREDVGPFRPAAPAPRASAPAAAPGPRARRHPAHGLRPPVREPGQPPWHASLFRYSTDGTPLARLFAALSGATGIPVALDAKLHGSVAGRFALPPQRMLDTLARSFALDWYYDGTVLHVVPRADVQHLSVRLNFASPDAVLAALRREHLLDPRHPVQLDDAAQTISASGPGAYVALLTQSIRTEDEAAARAGPETAVRIVPLRRARAAARDVPGASANGGQGGVASLARQRLTPLLPRGAVEFTMPLPAIVADPNTNTVLIRDVPGRLDADARTVASLDVASPLVEVVALVAELDAAALPSLALDDGMLADGTAIAHATLDDSGRSLRARIEALRASGSAQVSVDSPLRTLDGVAVDYAQQAGRPVAAPNGPGRGFALSVRPHVVAQTAAGAAVELDVAFGAAGAPARARVALQPGAALLLIEPLDAAGKRVRVALLSVPWVGVAATGEP